MATSQKSKIQRIDGRAIVVRGDDIDTDRIIPARYLKTITFERLEEHVFEDDRKQLAERGVTHPIDQTKFTGASVMLVASNFGCGSSREHAPQAIARWGIKAIIGISFAEIFAGNSLMIGLVTATVTPEHSEQLMAIAEADPTVAFHVDIEARTVTAGTATVPIVQPESARSALLSGDWDATSLLVDHYEQVETTAASLPYVSGWARF